MPRLHGYRQRNHVDIPIHVDHLDRTYERTFGKQADDLTVVVVDVAASRPDITVNVDVDVHDYATGGHRRQRNLTVTGPWLTGKIPAGAGPIVDILMVADDAMKEGKTMSAMEVIAEALTKPRAGAAILRPVIVPVRAEWSCKISLNDGAPPGPADVWLRTLETRDVA